MQRGAALPDAALPAGAMPRGTREQDGGELWARLGDQPLVASSFYALYKYDEMRAMLGIVSKNYSKAKLSQRLERKVTELGGVPAGSTAPQRRPPPPPRGSSRGKSTNAYARANVKEPPASASKRCTQTLARGWYTPKCTSSLTAASTKAIKTGDVVWCKLGDAPWWPALVAVRDCQPVGCKNHEHCRY